jgi:predicted Rossmann-fold nucleotide-binding protein
MDEPHTLKTPFPSAAEDVKRHRDKALTTPQSRSAAYQLAYADDDFIQTDEMRGVRLLLELSKPEITLREHNIHHTIVMFGSARIPSPEQADKHMQAVLEHLKLRPDDTTLLQAKRQAEKQQQRTRYYREARALAEKITRESCSHNLPRLHIVTGGGPGIMEAANRGASDAGGESIGLNITLPAEQKPNAYITPALIIFPGGFGTLDELFDALTLVQTGKIEALPIIAFDRQYWESLLNFDLLVEEGMISAADRQLIQFVDSADEAWQIIRDFVAQNGDRYAPTKPFSLDH